MSLASAGNCTTTQVVSATIKLLRAATIDTEEKVTKANALLKNG